MLGLRAPVVLKKSIILGPIPQREMKKMDMGKEAGRKAGKTLAGNKIKKIQRGFRRLRGPSS